MKIDLKLVETGYRFGSDERLLVLLTNSLQPSRGLDLEERMRLEALAHEAQRARIMAEIDNAIEEHGGWPGAFQVGC